MFDIRLTKKAEKFYQKANASTVRRLNLAFERLSEDPFRPPHIKRLKGELIGSFRLRIGDIRIIYSVDEPDEVVYIEIIGYRGDIYKT